MYKPAIGFLAGIASAVGLLMSSANAQTVLTVTSWEPPNHPYVTHGLIPWTKEVEKATQGRVKINILAKSIATPGATFDAVRNGLADIGYSVHGYSPGRFTLTKAGELPFIGGSAENVSIAYWRIHQRYFAKANEHEGVKLLGIFFHGPGAILSKKPINSVDDLKGMKVRVAGGVTADIAGKLGMVGLLKPAPESYMLLQTGVADGTLFPMEALNGFNLTKLAPYATQFPKGLFNVGFFFAMNQASFDRLSKQDQDALMSVSGEALARLQGKSWDYADELGAKAAKDAGNTIVTASPQLVADVKKATESIEKEWIAAAAKKGVDGAEALKALRAEVEKLERR